jgi:hypothetical protein
MKLNCFPGNKCLSRLLKVLLAGMLIISFPDYLFSQADGPLTYYDISKTRLADTISGNMEMVLLSPDSSLAESYSTLHFSAGKDTRKTVSDANVPKTAVIRFKVCNNGDTIKGVYFFPGFYFNTINLYRAQGNTITPLPRILPYTQDSIGYRYFTLLSKDSATIIVELKMEKTYNNVIRPRLVYEL